MADAGNTKPAAPSPLYSGDEASIDAKDLVCAADPNATFEARKVVSFREEVSPLVDPDLGIVIGYRGRGTVWRVYDIEGNVVTMEEVPLETPLFDPIDLIGGFGAKYFFSSSSRMAATVATKVAIRGISAGAAALLRRALSKLLSGSALKFTATTAQRMATPGRFVPLQILGLAIKHGAKSADPQKVKGAVMYTIKMTKYVGRDLALNKAVFKEYTLEVVVREADNTVLHFVYR